MENGWFYDKIVIREIELISTGGVVNVAKRTSELFHFHQNTFYCIEIKHKKYTSRHIQNLTQRHIGGLSWFNSVV